MKFIIDIIERLKASRQVFINFFYLGISYSTNLILPLVVMPFLVKTVGIERFGLISVAQAVMMFINIFVDYGFNLTATREIAISANNSNKKNYLFSVVLSTKLLLCLISLCVLCIYAFIQHLQNADYRLLLFSFPIVIGQMLIPQWFFQGLEKLQYIAIVNVFFKTLSIVLIFFLIKNEEDYVYVNLLQGLGGCVAGFFCNILVFTTFKIKLIPISPKNIKHEIIEGWYIFTANFANSTYIYSNVIILQLFASFEVVGYYSIAEKISNSLKQVMAVITQATYPIACKLANESHKKLVFFMRQIFIPLIFILFVICIFLYFYADVVNGVIGAYNKQVVNYIQLMAFVPLIVFVNSPAYQTLLVHNLRRPCSNVLIAGAFLNLISNTILSYYYQAYGTIASIILTELFITVTLYLLLTIKYKQYTLF